MKYNKGKLVMNDVERRLVNERRFLIYVIIWYLKCLYSIVVRGFRKNMSLNVNEFIYVVRK